MATRKRKFWGWGYEDQGLSLEEQRKLGERMTQRFGLTGFKLTPAPTIDQIALRKPRVAPPSALAAIFSADPHERAGHTYGKSFRDIVRGLRREFPNPPDLIAFPTSEQEVVAVLEWCDAERIIAIPYGGGSSVVGGTEPPVAGDYRGVISLDLARLDRVLEIDRRSRTARIQGGIFGPALEDELKLYRLTLRHFPQSFEFSSLGGWIATRSGGHYATLYTHIDDFVESTRVVTPAGIVESRRLPGSGAGPSPDRMFIGSEGILGVITEAWMRLQDRPSFRAGASVMFDDFMRGAEAVRAIALSGLYPANCRLLDAGEAANSGASRDGSAVLVLAFESADHPLDAWMKRALECCADHGGRIPDPEAAAHDAAATHEGAAGAWRQAFLAGPYVHDAMVALGMLNETFETAITWDRFADFHSRMMERTLEVARRVCGQATVTCRLTHAYPDGAAPYYTVIAPALAGGELAQWAEIKGAASDLLIELGGTITHHHAVGRDHRPWYDRQRPEGFARALKAAKRALDPNAILNPGVLIDP
ncbi:MAG TPA: FAD-binding oxidoreductase [Candidatus Binataceae bacterium]|nr:FAD-binding oxidoreductase [Candidatus Binataceae bacterium]